ncbi:TIGR04325 family methyltransferase [Pedobacter metabolipauper]|uniref:Putative methyltransferase (TIGR04325 family) n=1 Tax=Pedobacter metabolipauper TaxID=425513 RepID=A0A4R6SV53_9SPHI|nr:TIGR04325 family methyltransferase [Pedobacter metabolipauper]TDQ09251.1 putative methyltransferase (TIGR04325 family) [Pedobacter metabolipauper]
MLKTIFSKRKREQYGWFGDYPSWSKVTSAAGGYDSDIILQKTKDSLLKVKAGEAVYERDSVIFNEKEYPYSLLAYLMLSVTIKKRPLHILDFGGSLGSTYYQIKDFLTSDKCASWNVVEQEHYVACGKANFEDDTLKFYNSIDECYADKDIDFVLLSSSVQYLPEPHVFLKKLATYNFDFLLFDRTAFSYTSDDRLTLQIVPPEIYPASYPAWFFHEEFFLSHFSDQYKVVAEFPSYVNGEAVMYIDAKPAGANKGFYLINISQHA